MGLGRGARPVRRRDHPARRVRLCRVARDRPARAAAPLPRARPERLRAGARAQRRRLPRHVLHDRPVPAAGARRQRADTPARTSCRWGSRRSRPRSSARSSSPGSAPAPRTSAGPRSASSACCCSARRASDSGYALDILPGLVVFGLGLPLVGVANQIAAVAEVPHEDAGAASGIVTPRSRSAGRSGSRSSPPRPRRASATRSRRARRSRRRSPRASSAGCSSPPGSPSLNLLVGAVRAPRIKPDAALVAEATAG